MSRLTQSLVVEREDFIRSLFKANPELTGTAAQGLLTEKYGSMMRPNRLYELKDEILKKGAKVAPKAMKKATPVRKNGNADIFASMKGRIRIPDGYELVTIPVLVAKR